MQYKGNTLSPFPRLVLEKSVRSPTDMVGYLETADAQKIKVGNSDSEEFLLMQCLFSPRNFLTARFDPVAQTYERVFNAMHSGVGVLQASLSDPEGRAVEMASRVEKSISHLRRTAVGKQFSFTSKEGRVRMEVLASVMA